MIRVKRIKIDREQQMKIKKKLKRYDEHNIEKLIYMIIEHEHHALDVHKNAKLYEKYIAA